MSENSAKFRSKSDRANEVDLLAKYREIGIAAIAAANQTFHRMIVAEVWGDPDASDAQNLRVFVSQLRRKVEADPRRPELIVTDPGVGYRFLPGGSTEA